MLVDVDHASVNGAPAGDLGYERAPAKPGGRVAVHTNAREPVRPVAGVGKTPGSDLLSHTVSRAVPSAVESLTSVFGMGTGVAPLL